MAKLNYDRVRLLLLIFFTFSLLKWLMRSTIYCVHGGTDRILNREKNNKLRTQLVYRNSVTVFAWIFFHLRCVAFNFCTEIARACCVFFQYFFRLHVRQHAKNPIPHIRNSICFSYITLSFRNFTSRRIHHEKSSRFCLFRIILIFRVDTFFLRVRVHCWGFSYCEKIYIISRRIIIVNLDETYTFWSARNIQVFQTFIQK